MKNEQEPLFNADKKMDLFIMRDIIFFLFSLNSWKAKKKLTEDKEKWENNRGKMRKIKFHGNRFSTQFFLSLLIR